MRTKTTTDVMRRAHEITAPTFSAALAQAWEETREIEKDYAEAVAKAKQDLTVEKYDDKGNFRKFNNQEDVAEFVANFLKDRSFPADVNKVHANMYEFRLSPLEVLEVNTFSHGWCVTIHALKIKKG